MAKDFQQIQWDQALIDDCRQLIRLAVREDLDRTYDWTTLALVSESACGQAEVVARRAGVICGLPAAELTLQEMNIPASWQPQVADGTAVPAGTCLARVQGPARDLLTAERLVLNLIGRLSGVASLTRQFVEAVAGLPARIYDTRKTTPGWRRLEKYAVACGGGRNHRTGLFDALLIKDNHLALLRQQNAQASPATAVQQAREFLQHMAKERPGSDSMIIEVEVDTLDQLRQVLPAQPDIVLLDNMTPAQLREAVQLRDQLHCATQLEASGGVRLETVQAIAASGVERISVGALTHAATSLDVALDWTL